MFTITTQEDRQLLALKRKLSNYIFQFALKLDLTDHERRQILLLNFNVRRKPNGSYNVAVHPA